MPWHTVSGHSECPKSKPWAVVLDSDGSVAGCHPTKADAEDQMAALYANESKSRDPRPERDIFGHERRSMTGFEVRAKGDRRQLHGYAATFDQRAHIQSFAGGFVESIAPGAFRKTVSEHDIKLLVNHDPSLLLARNRADTLRLSEDETGLVVDADLPDTSAGRDVSVSMERGDISEMSFAFDVIRDSWNFEADPIERRLLEVRLFDVSVVTYPAYANTTAALRHLRSLGLEGSDDRLLALYTFLNERRGAAPTYAQRAGDEPLTAAADTEPAMSHSLRGYALRYRTLVAMYGFDIEGIGDANPG
jgi:HK97 family phage prohead protease